MKIIGLVLGVVTIGMAVWMLPRVWPRKVLLERFTLIAIILLGVMEIRSALRH